MVLVDAVVGQMHARVPEHLGTLIVLDRGEPDQALLIQIDDQWVIRGHGHVQAHVTLVSVHQQRVFDVLADYYTLIQWDLVRLMETGGGGGGASVRGGGRAESWGQVSSGEGN